MVGIAFYTPETYARLLREADDRDGLHENYSDWLRDFKKMEKKLKKEGFAVTPVPVNLDQLRLWCLLRQLPNNGASRSRWVQEEGPKFSGLL